MGQVRYSMGCRSRVVAVFVAAHSSHGMRYILPPFVEWALAWPNLEQDFSTCNDRKLRTSRTWVVLCCGFSSD